MRWQIALGSAALAVMAAFLLAITQQPASGNDRQVHSTVKDLMEAILDPSADVLWGAVGTVLDKDQGTVESTPTTDEQWTDVRRAAVRIIEGANLLLVPAREAAPPGTKSVTPGVELEPAEIDALINRNRDGFDDYAIALRALGWEAVQASDAKDPEALLDVGGRIQEVCEACHQTFWYPNERIP